MLFKNLECKLKQIYTKFQILNYLLGIHLTPRINKSSLIGPNAIPVFKKDIQGYDLKDMRDIPSIITNNIILFASNKSNYRKHALSELCFNLKNKFHVNTLRYFVGNLKSNFQMKYKNVWDKSSVD